MSSSDTVAGIDTDCMTIGRWILSEQRNHPSATGNLSYLLHSIQTACKTISMAVRKAGITKIFGLSGITNSTGDATQKLDILSNTIFINMLKSSHTSCVLISEENEEAIVIPEDGNQDTKYVVAFDPLDGSSNIDCLAAIGSIFGVWKKPDNAVTVNDHLQSGRNLVASGYILYGSATMFVLALGGKVNGFTLDPSIGEFVLSHKNMKIPKKGSIYSINEGMAKNFDPALEKYLHSLKFPTDQKNAYKSRYVGSMVSDVHRTILYGGIFIYPGSKTSPNGKLRLMYESNPIAYIIECAGGMAVTPFEPILDIKPRDIHERCPVYLGSPEDVLTLQQYYKNEKLIQKH